jgi:RNA polymerase sigma factor (sigma-70 family)
VAKKTPIDHSPLTIDDSSMHANRYDHISDQELLEYYYADKNQEWIGILLQRYTLLLLGVCMKYLKDETEARDCVQQIFLKVLTEAPKYKIDYFKSWLYMVAKNHCLMRLRDKGARAMKELTDQDIAVQENNKQELLQHEQTYELLEEAIGELNEEQRVCVNLFYLQKKSYQQISEQTGYSLMQVKSYIQNGKRNLKIILERKLKNSQQRR